MSRIIPWNLPEVAGGSLGGYTVIQDDSDPEPVIKYFNFDNVAIDTIAMNCVLDQAYTLPANGSFDDAVVISTQALTISGINEISLLGVASVQVKLNCDWVAASNYSTTSEIVYSLNLVNKSLTFQSGTLSATSQRSDSISLHTSVPVYNRSNTTSAKLTFYVYNGNGEIIQTEEVTIV